MHVHLERQRSRLLRLPAVGRRDSAKDAVFSFHQILTVTATNLRHPPPPPPLHRFDHVNQCGLMNAIQTSSKIDVYVLRHGWSVSRVSAHALRNSGELLFYPLARYAVHRSVVQSHRCKYIGSALESFRQVPRQTSSRWKNHSPRRTLMPVRELNGHRFQGSKSFFSSLRSKEIHLISS